MLTPAAVAAKPARAWVAAASVDLALVLVILVASALWGTRYWNTWVARGNRPQFYQSYFEPAVMVACGKGYVVSQPQPAAIVDFLHQRRDRFTCADIPNGATLGRQGLYQGAWRYLLTTVGWFWRVRGVSWSGMGPLFGIGFAMTIALAYAICRLGMGRPLAAIVAFALAISTVHLINLPHLRDYAKAPFTLALILVLALLVTRPVRPRTVLGLAAAYGAIMGIGYGFRTDFLANLPVLIVVLFAFLAGGLRRNLALKAAAALTFVATFLVVSWPVTSTVYEKGGCQWHVALLGLQSPFDAGLHIRRAPYDFGYAYADFYIYRAVSAFAYRPSPANLGFCSHEYDVASWTYLKSIVVRFPADVATRALGAAGQVIETPFAWLEAPMPGWFGRLYRFRMSVVTRLQGYGIYLIAAALLMVSATSVRLAFFLLFFVLYFGGYPAVQFHDRHYFHLEFMTWFALAFVLQHTLGAVWRLAHRQVPDAKTLTRAAGRTALFAAVTLVLLVAPLRGLRWYQQRQVTKLLSAYLEAPRQPILGGALSAGTIYKVPPAQAATGLAQVVEIDLNQRSCAPKPSVTFRYDPAFPVDDFTGTVTVDRSPASSGVTRVFVVVFEHFMALEFSDPRPECVVGAYRLTDARAVPILLDATLPPDWQRRPLYQRLTGWERQDDTPQ